MSNSPRDEYFAAQDAEKTASILLTRANTWFHSLESNGYLDKLREMWAAYHGAYYSGFDDGHRITFGGEQGEIAQLPVNHLRNIADHMVVMITATRPSMQARAINTDYKSLVQAKLANSLLDYYMRDKRLEKYIQTAVKYAIVLGSGYIKIEWNATSGEIYDYDEITLPSGERIEVPIYEGDAQFSNLSPFDIVFDSTKESQDHDWVLCRSFKNRFDLIAKYPELKDRIVGLPTKSELEKFRFNTLGVDETDDIPVYEFYHKQTESMPNGRYLLFLAGDITLSDGPMPYVSLPIYRISPADILGTPYGYSPLFDILPIQDAINSLYSTILSNQSAFGIQNIIMPRGSDVNPVALTGGLNVIEYNSQFGKPEALNLTQTPEEIFKFLEMLVRDAETISGVNSVTRGNPEASLKSGNALALIQSMALQFISGLQQSYVALIEDTGTGLINMLKIMASVPRLALIAGKTNKMEMKEFSGDDLANVSRVIVDVGNPLANTTAGRVQMAEQMLQMGIIKTPEQYLTVMNTGQLDVIIEDTQSELLLIRRENEDLIEGGEVITSVTDQHAMHIKEHKCILSDPDLRRDPELLNRVLMHIQEHIDALRNTDPDLLMLMGEQPLAPPGAMNPPPMPMNQPQQGAPPPPMPNSEVMAQPQTEMAAPNAMLPQPAVPPAPFQSLPTNPANMVVQ